jgi:4-amino-4-deoxychorismate lyase
MALIDGKEACDVAIADRAFQYGDGIFTTLPVNAGIPAFLSDHLARLRRDAASLNLPFPGERILREETLRLAAAHPECILKIILTRGRGGRGYRPPEHAEGTRALSVHPKPAYPPELRSSGIEARWCRIRLGINPALAGIKHLNRLEQVMARAEWNDDNVREGFLLDYEGFLVEGISSNVFLAQGGVLRTPLLDRCGVAGVMRAKILAGAPEWGMKVEERRIRPEEVYDADELFVSNSVVGVWPVRRLETREFGAGAIARRASEGLRALMEREAAACHG